MRKSVGGYVMRISREEIENYQKIAKEYNSVYEKKIHDIYIEILKNYLDDNNVHYSIVSNCRFFVQDNAEREYELFIDGEAMQLVPKKRENESWYRICFHAEFCDYPYGTNAFWIKGYEKGELLDRYLYLNLSDEQTNELRDRITNHANLMKEKMEYMKVHNKIQDYKWHYYLHKNEEVEFYNFDDVMEYVYSDLSK